MSDKNMISISEKKYYKLINERDAARHAEQVANEQVSKLQRFLVIYAEENQAMLDGTDKIREIASNNPEIIEILDSMVSSGSIDNFIS